MDVAIGIHVAWRHGSRLRDRAGAIPARRAVHTGSLRAKTRTGNRQDVIRPGVCSRPHHGQVIGRSRIQVQVRRLRRGKCGYPVHAQTVRLVVHE